MQAPKNQAHMATLELVEGNIVKITPINETCKNQALVAKVVFALEMPPHPDIAKAYWVDFIGSDMCLKFVDEATNTPIGYWLMKNKPGKGFLWTLRGAPINNVMQIYDSEVIEVGDVQPVEIIPPHVDAGHSAMEAYRRRAKTNLVAWNDPDTIKPDLRLIRSRDPNSGRQQTKVQLSTGETYYIDKENMERIRLQNDILARRKPQLIRQLAGASFAGMGIRSPPESEFRKEWRNFKANDRLAVEVRVTKPNGDFIAAIVLLSKVEARYAKSPLINGLGTAYALDVTDAKGIQQDVFAFTPRRIGRRKIRYWLCVYDDLYDTKVIASSESVSHDELVRNLKSGDGSFRLAEYAVQEIKLTNEFGDVVAFPGDEDTPESRLARQKNAHGEYAIEFNSAVQSGVAPSRAVRARVNAAMDQEIDSNNTRADTDGVGDYIPKTRSTIKNVAKRAPPLQRVNLAALRGAYQGVNA